MPAPPAVSAVVQALVDTGHEYQHLFDIYAPIALGVFVLIAVAVGYAVMRYRGRAPQQAARWHEHNLLEGSYAVLLACVVAFLLYLTFTAEHQVDTVANAERAGVTIDVTASKWEWRFHYPAYGISVRSGTVGRQQLVVPANEAMRFNLTSADVIHAFWIPALRYKRDAIPGRYRARSRSMFDRDRGVPGSVRRVLRAAPRRHGVHVRAVAGVPFAAWATAGGAALAR